MTRADPGHHQDEPWTEVPHQSTRTGVWQRQRIEPLMRYANARLHRVRLYESPSLYSEYYGKNTAES